MHRLFHIDLSNTEDRNVWYLCIEIFWAAVLSGAAAFVAPFALRLNASNTEIGLMSSIPAFISMLLSIPAGRFLATRRKRYPWVLVSLTVTRLGYLLLAIIPWLHLGGISQGLMVVIVISSLNIPAQVANIGFMDIFASVIPVERRASVMIVRNIMSAGGVSLSLFLFGLWLDLPSRGSPWREWIPFPMNYQIMFLIACIVVQLSIYYLLKIKVPEARVAAPPSAAAPATVAERKLQTRFKNLYEFARRQPNFLRLTISTILFSIGLWAIGPLGIILLIRKFGATDGWIGLNNTLANVVGILGWTLARWIIPRLGEEKTLKFFAPLIGLSSVIFGLSPALMPILGVTTFSSLINPSFGLSQTNLLLRVMPEESRPDYYAVWTSITSVGAFICPMIGVALANQFGVAQTIIGGGLLSMLAATAFWIMPVQIKE